MYSFDASGLINPWRRHYVPEIFPGFWDALQEHIADGTARACDEVKQELKRRDDDLNRWVRAQAGFFVPFDSEQQRAARDIMAAFPKWVESKSRKNLVALVVSGDPPRKKENAMKTYVISYDLCSPGRNYSALYEAIDKLAIGGCRPLESVWIVASALGAGAIRDHLTAHVDSNDRIFVMECAPNHWATLHVDNAVNKWLKTNVAGAS